MDDDLRNAFATLSAQISVVATDLRANTSLTADLSRKVSDVAVEQKAQAGRIHVIEKAVFGSVPPPAPPTRPFSESLNEHDGEIATLAGQIIAARSELAEVKTEVASVKTEVSDVKQLNVEQTKTLKTIAGHVGGILSHPTVKRIATLAAGLLLAWLTAKTQGLLK